MSDLAFLILVGVLEGLPTAYLLLAVIWEIWTWARERANEEQQRAPVVVDQRTALARLAALADMEAAAKRAARPAVLPYFPYANQGRGSETLCAICVEPLQQGQLCSEVPACRHAFHRDCLGVWARSKGSCPLCRAKIEPGSNGVAVADDVV